MKILRADKNGQAFYAALLGEKLKRINGLPYDNVVYTGEEYRLSDVKLLSPCEPSKIIAVGLNYARHARELKEQLTGTPVLFLKPPTSLLAHGQDIVYPHVSSRVDYEAELAVVIKKSCKQVSVHDALDYVFGYTALNDVTARDLQKADGQWTRAKSFDTFCPVGPYIDTGYDPSSKRVMSVLNGVVKQDARTDDMLFGVAELISFISECMTLLPGDIIATGTPEGIGPMQKGDVIEIKIEGLMTLQNNVI
ncbi:MAG: fumarylacetoacetate hydrolase family protein [Christensenellales bacterium]|jgi:2-keto-4-pentenoate hydratase/2-oxohepta-3-ene-1,7-dioic acid hydratase in catechol pathway